MHLQRVGAWAVSCNSSPGEVELLHKVHAGVQAQCRVLHAEEEGQLKEYLNSMIVTEKGACAWLHVHIAEFNPSKSQKPIRPVRSEGTY